MSGWATDPATSRGRRWPEAATGGFRTAFQRDRDRIIHSISFRRLRHKTQVFVAPDGDHFRVRLTHSIEVAQIARTIARALRLDEDLTEAIALAHDLGHPPFGHAGEAALDPAMAAAGGFDHNGHTLRTVALLDSPYPGWPGLNLTWETLSGLAKHNGQVAHPGWAMAAVDAAWPLDLHAPPSLEAQVAAIADDIAYDNHDIDDGVRAGLLTRAMLAALPAFDARVAAAHRRHPEAGEVMAVRQAVRDQIGAMVEDVVTTARAAIAIAGRDARIGFSAAMAAEERALKAFMYANLYHHPSQLAVAARARRVVAGLFAAYRDDPARMPADWAARVPDDPVAAIRHIGDFVAGMTDRYAIARYEELVGPAEMPDAF